VPGIFELLPVLNVFLITSLVSVSPIIPAFCVPVSKLKSPVLEQFSINTYPVELPHTAPIIPPEPYE
jgi:hypothetical protein